MRPIVDGDTRIECSRDDLTRGKLVSITYDGVKWLAFLCRYIEGVWHGKIVRDDGTPMFQSVMLTDGKLSTTLDHVPKEGEDVFIALPDEDEIKRMRVSSIDAATFDGRIATLTCKFYVYGVVHSFPSRMGHFWEGVCDLKKVWHGVGVNIYITSEHGSVNVEVGGVPFMGLDGFMIVTRRSKKCEGYIRLPEDLVLRLGNALWEVRDCITKTLRTNGGCPLENYRHSDWLGDKISSVDETLIDDILEIK